eukprot:TRINITY_DN18433_c0_g1_i5.p1 TRINITY_DN18433_c0_g1~~TRINITY_DN18433_c0_g1_i5.p1  ORF type:complete len:458 (+),score=95.09 TRINITY_DN18433_c0_g1_i5:226-1599(+)
MDWDTTLEICRQLGAGILLPKKTYQWIKGMEGSPNFPPASKGTISELLCTIAALQQALQPEARIGELQLGKLARCIHLLMPREGADWSSCGAYVDSERGQGALRQVVDRSKFRRSVVKAVLEELARARAIVLAMMPTQHDLEGELSPNKRGRPRRACTARGRTVLGYDDHWWPSADWELDAFVADNMEEIQDLTDKCEVLDAARDGDTLPHLLKDSLARSQGGMVCVENVDCQALWHRLCLWIQHPTTLQMVGGTQADVSSGKASFQMLKMERGMPKPYPARSTLGSFLSEPKAPACAVASVGIPAWCKPGEERSLKELDDFWEQLMKTLNSLGIKTGQDEDVLELAGIDLCGVGVRRPEVYIKRGRGRSDPFITLRHAEWGNTMAFNMVLNSWDSERALIQDGDLTGGADDSMSNKEPQTFVTEQGKIGIHQEQPPSTAEAKAFEHRTTELPTTPD